MEEYYFLCPYCGEEISVLLDLSCHSQTYIEDCEVCCRPIQISYRAKDDEITAFQAIAIQ